MLEAWLSGLNSEQQQAVTSVDGPLRIVAGAGSGKTKVITYKIAYLIKALNLPPWKILAVTFTNKAAQEMKQRCYDLVGEVASQVQISTYHAFCVYVLRQDIKVFNYPSDFNIIDQADKINIIKTICKNHHYDFDRSEQWKLSSFISQWKHEHRAATEIDASEDYSPQYRHRWAQVYREYKAKLSELKALDFDDLLLFVERLFDEFPEVLAKWQRRYAYVLVDEFQDSSPVQFKIIHQLVKAQPHLTVVGDPDQTIYTWRGATVELILDFNRYFPNAKTIILTKNYRSSAHILTAANQLIANNRFRVKKDLEPTKVWGSKIILKANQTRTLESEWVATEIKSLQEQGVKLKQIAILYRANYLSRDLEQALVQAGINYKLFGAFRFYERKEIKDVLAYLKAIVYGDDLSYERILALTPKIGAKTIADLSQLASANQLTLEQVITQEDLLPDIINRRVSSIREWITLFKPRSLKLGSAFQFATLFLRAVGYLNRLKANFETDAVDNVNELLNQLKAQTANQPEEAAESIPIAAQLTSFLQQISLYTSQDEIVIGDFVSLMTVHNAKGLEYDYVFLIGLNEGVFPSNHALSASDSAIEEERRLLYVAMTRAKQQLYLSYAQGFSYFLNQLNAPSRFLTELPNNQILNIAVDRSGLELESKKTMSSSLSFELHDKPELSPTHNYAVGDEVLHEVFGRGKIIKLIGNNKLQIAFSFQQGGMKILAANSAFLKKIIH